MSLFFFFNDTATTEIYTLSLHDALPISCEYTAWQHNQPPPFASGAVPFLNALPGSGSGALLIKPTLRLYLPVDRKSTRLNSSHANISYAVFCLKKKKKQQT